MGADPIVLVGFDMNDRTHFHGEYLMGETSVAKYTGEMEIMRGRNIITTTENSGLSHIFPYRPLKDFFNVTFLMKLQISPFLFIFSMNTLFGLGIYHGFYEYLAVWALIVVVKGATT
jgi:hypothetical protein